MSRKTRRRRASREYDRKHDSAQLIRVSRLKDGAWTWQVSALKGTTLEELREAKEIALQIAYELRDELQPTLDEVQEEVAF